MGWPLIGGIAAGLGGLLLGSKGGGGEGGGGIQKTTTLSPEQLKLMKELGPWLEGLIGEGLPGYPGQQVAGMAGEERIGMGLLQDYITRGIGPTAELGVGQYQEALKGMTPEEVHEQYMKYTAPAEARYLKETMIPTFKESMVPGGTLRSTGTERGIGDIISRFGEGQLGRIGERITAERAGARGMMPLLPTMAGMEGGVPQMEAAFQYGQLPRMIEQAEMTAMFEEFKRTTPELSPIIDKMLSYMGIQTQAAFNQPYQPSPFLQFLGAVGPGLGSYLGAGAAAS